MTRYATKQRTVEQSRYGGAVSRSQPNSNPYPARRDLQPMVAAYLQREGIPFKHHASGLSLRCPFHDDAHPSLLMASDTGRYRCMACGASGSGLVAFHAAVRGTEWKDSLRELQQKGLV